LPAISIQARLRLLERGSNDRTRMMEMAQATGDRVPVVWLGILRKCG